MTRFYLPSTTAAAVSPAFNISWDENASADRLKCVTTKIASAMTSKTVAKGTGATRALVRQYVSDPIAAQTIYSDAAFLKGQVRCLESAVNDNLDLVPCCVRIVSNDGSTYRSPDLLALGDYAAASEFATSLTNRKIADGETTSEVIASQGDRIVIEIGEKNSAAGVSISGSFSFGDDSATDLPEDTTTTAANNPWVEVGNEINFIGDTTQGPWSDNLNAQQAPMKSLARITQLTVGTSTGGVGNNAANEGKGQKFTAVADGKLIRTRFAVVKVGTPTDSVVCKLYDDNAGAPGTLLATSLAVQAVSVPTSVAVIPFEFSVPPTLTNGNVYYAILFRTGSLDAVNNYSVAGDNANPYAGGHIVRRSNSAWVNHTSEDCVFTTEQETTNWYKFEIDRDNAKLQAFRSTDNGANWTEQDGANAPAVANAAGRFACAVQRKGASFYVVLLDTIHVMKKAFPFDSGSNTWGSATSRTFSTGSVSTPMQFGVNVGDVGPVFHNYREFGVGEGLVAGTLDWSIFQSVAERISGVRYRRIRQQFGSSEPYLTGSGLTVHYDLRSQVADWRDWFYVFYTKSDSTQIQVATVASNSTTPTIVGGLTVSAVDQATKYPLGQGCNFWRDGVNYVAVPYVDGANIKVLYCESGTAANTAANWLSTTAAAVTAESNTSNPGFLVADNEQGGKLFLFYVDDTTGDLNFVHDDGTFTWSEPITFYDDGDVAGCAGSLSDGTIGMLIRDSSTFELLFKTMDVFFLKSDFTTGTYTTEKDFLVAGTVPYQIVIDVDEMAGTSYHIEVYTRETETDGWWDIGGIGAEAAESDGTFSFERTRYVRLEMTVTGGDVPNGVIGYAI